MAGSFHDGIAPVLINNAGKNTNSEKSSVYINLKGDIVSDFGEFDIGEFNDGYAKIKTPDYQLNIWSNKIKKLINRDFDIVFDHREYLEFNINNGFITAIKGDNGKYGVVDINNNIIIDFKYKFLSLYEDGLFRFIKENGMGFMDINENIIIEPIFYDADDFSNGTAIIIKNKEENNSIFKKVSIINKKGEFIKEDVAIEPGYIFFDSYHPNGIIKLLKDGQFFYINRDGNMIQPIRGQ